MTNLPPSKNSSSENFKKISKVPLSLQVSNNSIQIDRKKAKLDIELSETKSHISDNLMPETHPTLLDKSQGNQRYERRISSFFQASRIQKCSLKPLSCWKLSKGLILGIVFLIFFALVILWIVFSGENFEPDVRNSKNKFDNCTLKSNCTNGTNGVKNKEIKRASYWSYNFFVLFSTVIIVLSIITFVFVSASCRHFCQKSEYPARKNVFSSIFSQQNKRDSLYYLEKNEQMHLQKLYERRNTNIQNSIISNDENSFTNLSVITKLNNLCEPNKECKKTNIPIIHIIMDESEKTSCS
jgi:hypothetical protein